MFRPGPPIRGCAPGSGWKKKEHPAGFPEEKSFDEGRKRLGRNIAKDEPVTKQYERGKGSAREALQENGGPKRRELALLRRKRWSRKKKKRGLGNKIAMWGRTTQKPGGGQETFSQITLQIPGAQWTRFVGDGERTGGGKRSTFEGKSVIPPRKQNTTIASCTPCGEREERQRGRGSTPVGEPLQSSSPNTCICEGQ